jgi:NADH:ubiquinone oxidoreductase subunit H
MGIQLEIIEVFVVWPSFISTNSMGFLVPIVSRPAFRLSDIVNAQADVPFIVFQPLAFAIFIISLPNAAGSV